MTKSKPTLKDCCDQVINLFDPGFLVKQMAEIACSLMPIDGEWVCGEICTVVGYFGSGIQNTCNNFCNGGMNLCGKGIHFAII